jgi:hypothetical protein
LPAVLVAAFIVRSLPLGAIRWLVIVVVLYTVVAMLRSIRTNGAAAVAAAVLRPDADRQTP